MKGIDSPDTTTGKAHELLAQGISFVIRYCSPDTENFPSKQATQDECKGLLSVGIAVGFVFEKLSTIEWIEGFGSAHANQAVEAVNNAGANSACGIFFAVDFDATTDQIAGPISDYFTAINSVLQPAGYAVGCYGSGQVLTHLQNKGLITLAWLAQSEGWSMSREFTSYDIKQLQSGSVCELDVDFNEIQDGESFNDAGLLCP